jgi:hypothetical protein
MRSALAASSPHRLLLLAVFILYSGLSGWSQITNVANDTSTPIPGAGHDYIKMLSETVNPSNGSVSIRVQAPTPSGRGISLPFAFAYDSNGAAHITTDDHGTVEWAGNSAYLSQGGWSYSVPIVSTINVIVQLVPHGYCSYWKDYVFQDATGGRHSLGVAYVEDLNVCNNGGQYPTQVLNAGDD